MFELEVHIKGETHQVWGPFWGFEKNVLLPLLAAREDVRRVVVREIPAK